jgi:hypothetical protein
MNEEIFEFAMQRRKDAMEEGENVALTTPLRLVTRTGRVNILLAS